MAKPQRRKMTPRKTTPLARLRRSRTLSQALMAKAVGVSQQSLAKYELGKVEPTTDIKQRIAAILGVSVSEAFPTSEATAQAADAR